MVPRYIDALPDDSFAKESAPLQYNREDEVIYSVGEDGIDSGGFDQRNILLADEETPRDRDRWQRPDRGLKIFPHVPKPIEQILRPSRRQRLRRRIR